MDDGFGPDYERAGTIVRGEDSFDVLLVRTQPAEGPAIWLVSSQTLREIPAAFEDLTVPELDRVMPPPLRRQVGGSVRLWQVLAFLLLIPAAWLLARLLVYGTARLVDRPRAAARPSRTSGTASRPSARRSPSCSRSRSTPSSSTASASRSSGGTRYARGVAASCSFSRSAGSSSASSAS